MGMRFRGCRGLRPVAAALIVAVVAVSMVSTPASAIEEFLYQCLCEKQVSGVVGDCCCDVDTVDELNARVVAPKLEALVGSTFFRYLKLDLYRDCPFWQDSGLCLMEGCSLSTCNPSEIPQCMKDQDAVEEPTCPPHSERELSSIEDPFGVAGGHEGLKASEAVTEDVWMVDDDLYHEGSTAEFIDLQANPERFTGYRGFGARSVWGAIYGENCFSDDDVDDDDEEEEAGGDLESATERAEAKRGGGMCMEKRVFFRLISGLHASITCHLVGEYFFEERGEWGPNYEMYKARFEGHPEHLENLYFAYMLALRAIDKAAPLLEAYAYRTDNATEEALTQDAVVGLTSGIHETLASTCPIPFDETQLFQGPDAASLRREFQTHFYNISRIMDCVECSKCRLWGKIQIRGLSVVLRILFGDEHEVTSLTRAQIISLYWTMYRLSESLGIVRHMQSVELWRTLQWYALVGASIAGVVGAITAVFIRRCRKRGGNKQKHS